MKEYVNTFMHYRFLLRELVKKGIKLKFLSWYYMVPVGTSSYHDGTDDRIRYSVWKQRQDIPCIYPDRPSAVQLLFKFDDTRTEISPGECGDDQESLCAEVYLSAVKRTL